MHVLLHIYSTVGSLLPMLYMKDLSWVCFEFQWDKEKHALVPQQYHPVKMGAGVNIGSNDPDIKGELI